MSNNEFTKDEIISGVENDEFFLEYQPQFNANCDKIVGVEALIRWQHPTLGKLYPDSFISLVENHKFLVHYIGSFVYSEAIKASALWKKKTGSYLLVSINIGVKQLESTELVYWIMDVANEYRVPPKYLKIEVTENVSPENYVLIKRTLEYFSINGFSISIDDFGTGGATMNYLKMFPVHEVKIDRTYTEPVPYNEHYSKLCRAIIAFANAMDFSIVVEGIEEPDQIEFFRNEGVDKFQGFYFSKPVNLVELLTIENEFGKSVLGSLGLKEAS